MTGEQLSTQATPKINTARQAAYGILLRFEKVFQQTGQNKASGLKADRLLSDALGQAAFSPQDKALTYQLVLGVLKTWLVLNQLIKVHCHHPLHKLSPEVITLLRLGIYQLVYLDQVPAYAAINTTVELAKQQKTSPNTLKLINAVLRNVDRAQIAPITEPQANDFFSNDWLSRWGNCFSEASLAEMAEACWHPTPLSLRINTKNISISAYCEQLTQLETPWIQPEPGLLPECLLLPEWQGSPTQLPGFAEGHVYLQDISSAMVTAWLNPQPGEIVLDLCAAPGSKTTHCAERMQHQGHIIACDQSADRLKKLTENIQRLNIPSEMISLETLDGTHLTALQKIAAQHAVSKIIVDAPCSGLGTLRRHPEIRLQFHPKQLKQQASLQKQLLLNALTVLQASPAADKTLVYSVCSIDPAEGVEVVEAVLKDFPTITLTQQETRPISLECDGFYLAKLQAQF